MSSYPHWLLTLPVRPDVDPATLRVLAARTAGEAPARADLATLHPEVVIVVHDPAQVLVLTHGPVVGEVQLTVDVWMHDDHFADGGWAFWLWLYTLLDPTTSYRRVLGTYGPLRNDHDTVLVHAEADGVHEGDRLITFDEVRDGYATALDEVDG